MEVDVKVSDAGGELMLELASSALCNGDTLGGLYDDALSLAVGALRYRAKLHREKADDPPEGWESQADKWRSWGADDAQAADLIEQLLEMGREQVSSIEGLNPNRITIQEIRSVLSERDTSDESGK